MRAPEHGSKCRDAPLVNAEAHSIARDPQEALHAYVRAFETLNPEAVISFYHAPCTFIAPFGVTVAADVEAARRIASALIEHARCQGYRRTDTSQLHTRTLASNLVLLSGVFVRFGATNQEIGRFGFTYVMRDDGTGWRIVTAIAHDAPRMGE
jgi:hypothetical protein